MVNRRLNRRLSRFTTIVLHGRRRLVTPNYWHSAVRCFKRAVRCHRRLIKLAPARFDYGLVQARLHQAEMERPKHEKWEAALAEVYGPQAAIVYRRMIESKDAEPRISKASKRAIQRELDNWQRWLDAGGEAIILFRRHKQWSRVGLSGIAQLLRVAQDLGRLSTGLETTWKEPPSDASHWDFEAAVEKIYGSSATPGSTA